MRDRVTVLAPAKLNLALDVVGILPGGYHALDMTMQAVSLYERVVIRRSPYLDLETGFLPHRLQLADDFPHEALFQQFRTQIGVQYDGQLAFRLCHESALLRGLDQKILLRKLDSCPFDIKG